MNFRLMYYIVVFTILSSLVFSFHDGDPSAKEVQNLCGNKICEVGEDHWGCSVDCPGAIFELDKVFCSPIPECGNWSESWFSNLIMFAIIGGVIYLINKGRKVKRRL